MLTRAGKDVVQLVPNNSGQSPTNHGGIIPVPEHSHEMRAVYVEIREDPIRRDRGIGKNHARPARPGARIGFASCAGSFNGSNSNEIEVFAALAVCEIFPDDIDASRIEQPFQLGPHHLAGFHANALRMLQVQSQGSRLSVSANTERTHEQYDENRPHDERPSCIEQTRTRQFGLARFCSRNLISEYCRLQIWLPDGSDIHPTLKAKTGAVAMINSPKDVVGEFKSLPN
jgi:hypothetical protein